MALIFHLPLAWALLPMALWVVWGRVYAGLHYPFDIIGGAVLAALTVTIFYICILFPFWSSRILG
jgi:membrane-associated phospholipid phosphatase